MYTRLRKFAIVSFRTLGIGAEPLEIRAIETNQWSLTRGEEYYPIVFDP
jgi:hypothetical protein